MFFCACYCIFVRECNVHMNKYTLLFLLFIQAFFTEAQDDPSKRGTVTIKCDYRITELLEQYRKINLGKQIQGYRIQLYSGERAVSFEVKAKFLKQFPNVPCNILYEAPDFKIQVGNYRTALEAEADMQLIWPVFKSAFVVPAKIDLPELSLFTNKH